MKIIIEVNPERSEEFVFKRFKQICLEEFNTFELSVNELKHSQKTWK